MKKALFFKNPQHLARIRDATEFLFPYSIVDSSLLGTPEEKSRTSHFSIKVGVSGTLKACWNLTELQLVKVLFEYGKRHIIQKLKDGTLADSEELLLHTGNAEVPCPFDASRIEDPGGAYIEVDTGEQQLMQNATFLQLASTIIDTRDNINAIFHNRYKEKLILITEERDLLQFFRDASSQEEFIFRLCALAKAATGFNIHILRRIMRVTDTQIKSISLLEIYLNNIGAPSERIIRPLRYINKMRQGYPVHGDHVRGVLEAHKYFGFEYPVNDFSNSWRTLLLQYQNALQSLLRALREDMIRK